MYNTSHLLTTTPRGLKRLIYPESCVIACPTESPSSPSIVKTVLDNLKVHHRRTTLTNENETRHDFPTILHRVESNDRISSVTTTTMEEQPVPVRRHRRTHATNWDELMSQLDSINDLGIIQPRRHRRSLALTNDEFTEITMVCDELHGPFMIPFFL